MRRIRLLIAGGAAAALAGVLAVAVVALGDGGDDPDTAASATPPAGGSAPPGATEVTAISPLPEIRRDLATRFSVAPGDVELVRLAHAGWDGCLGVRQPGQACSEQFIAGYIALFTLPGGQQAEYHIGGGRSVGPIDRATAQVDDGVPVAPEMRVDFDSILADYARDDLGIRLNLARPVTVLQVVPFELDHQCLLPCDTHAAFVALQAGSEGFAYVVNSERPLEYKGREDPRTGGDAEVQLAMRGDLAGRLGIPLAQVSVVQYRLVTWPDGCLGAEKPGEVCSQSLVPGFLAVLEAAGMRYEYHGAGEHFIAVAFERDVRVSPPLPRETR